MSGSDRTATWANPLVWHVLNCFLVARLIYCVNGSSLWFIFLMACGALSVASSQSTIWHCCTPPVLFTFCESFATLISSSVGRRKINNTSSTLHRIVTTCTHTGLNTRAYTNQTAHPDRHNMIKIRRADFVVCHDGSSEVACHHWQTMPSEYVQSERVWLTVAEVPHRRKKGKDHSFQPRRTKQRRSRVKWNGQNRLEYCTHCCIECN